MKERIEALKQERLVEMAAAFLRLRTEIDSILVRIHQLDGAISVLEELIPEP